MSTAVKCEVEQDAPVEQAAGPASPTRAGFLDGSPGGDLAIGSAPDGDGEMAGLDGDCRLPRLDRIGVLYAKQRNVGRGIAASQGGAGNRAARQCHLGCVFVAEPFLGGDDESGAPQNAAQGAAVTGIDRHHASRRLLDNGARGVGNLGQGCH